MTETKTEINARINELHQLQSYLGKTREKNWEEELPYYFKQRIKQLEEELEIASDYCDELNKLILTSHDVICEVKSMESKAAYGQDPIMYYSLAINGEAGEMANKIVKGHRNGYNEQKAREAVISELPDIIIYSFILAFVIDIKLFDLVKKKVKIVIERAKSGYYGHEIQ